MAYDKRDGGRNKKTGGPGTTRDGNENKNRRRDETYSGESTRPKKRQSPGEQFFSGGAAGKPGGPGRSGRSGASDRGPRPSKPYGAPPRTARPKYAVPPSVQADAEDAHTSSARGGRKDAGYSGNDARNEYQRDHPRDHRYARSDARGGRRDPSFRGHGAADGGQRKYAPMKNGFPGGKPRYSSPQGASGTARRGPIEPHKEQQHYAEPSDTDNTYDSRDPNARPSSPREYPENLLVGRNPIREAIRAGRTIEKLLVANGELSGSAREIVAKAHENHIVVQKVDKSRLDAIYPKHQGMLAYVSEASYATVEEILDAAKARGEDPFVVALDGITDPHNLGAIIRTAECAGAHGVIVTERRSAGLNPAAVKASAGALNYIKVAKVVNLSRTLEELKEAGLWITGAATDGEDIASVDLTGPIALVVGSEGEGISQLVRKNCDRVVRLPIKGQIESLNASVAAGILLYDVLRARS